MGKRNKYKSKQRKNNKSYNNKSKQKKKIPKEIKDIIDKFNNCKMLSTMDLNELVTIDGIAYKVARYAFDKDMKNTQLRSFFEAIKKLQRNKEWKDIKPELILLKPRMAVRVGRGKIEEGFFKVIVAAMDKIEVDDEKETMKNFNMFVEFFEAIIAYHKYIGGDNV